MTGLIPADWHLNQLSCIIKDWFDSSILTFKSAALYYIGLVRFQQIGI